MLTDTAIVGAGPYGLSVAAHLRSQGVPFRIFGRPMDSWRSHMPKGMLLKSEGFASSIYDPEGRFPLHKFCAEQGIPYADDGLPVRRETFVAYGLAFQERMVPEVENRLVVSITPAPGGFKLGIDDGETLTAQRVVMAVGITHFASVPPALEQLPPEYLSHSFHHHEVDPFRGRKVIVIGGGASALDLAGLLRDADADVHLVARARTLNFHTKSSDTPSWWRRIRYPKSGIGSGLESRFYADYPGVFHYLPEPMRLRAVRNVLGPAGGWFIKEKVLGRVPVMLGWTVKGADVRQGNARLQLRGDTGAEHEIMASHVIAATGYKVDLRRLTFLSPGMRDKIKVVQGSPVLSSSFESSIPGLYFVGVAAATSFGPVLRFAFGARYAAQTVTQALAKSLARGRASVPVPCAVSNTE